MTLVSEQEAQAAPEAVCWQTSDFLEHTECSVEQQKKVAWNEAGLKYVLFPCNAILLSWNKLYLIWIQNGNSGQLKKKNDNFLIFQSACHVLE